MPEYHKLYTNLSDPMFISVDELTGLCVLQYRCLLENYVNDPVVVVQAVVTHQDLLTDERQR